MSTSDLGIPVEGLVSTRPVSVGGDRPLFKTCSRCGEAKSVSDFPAGRNRCKQCRICNLYGRKTTTKNVIG